MVAGARRAQRCSARLGFVAVRAMIGAWSNLGMQAASVGPFVVHGAATGFGIQKLAVAAGPAGQAENAVFEIEVLDKTGFGQTLGNLFGVFVLGLKRVHQLQTHQIG